jgi:hypothetical protein
VSVPDKADPHSRRAVGEQRIETNIAVEVETAAVRVTALVSQMASWKIEPIPEEQAAELANHCQENREHLQFLAECRQDGDASSAGSPAVAAREDPEETFPGSTLRHRQYGDQWLLLNWTPRWYKTTCEKTGIPWRQKSMFDWERRCHPCDVLPSFPMDESAMAQEALDLLRAVPRVSVLHGLKDDHSTIVEHEPFWRILLGAEEGDGIENRTPHFKTGVCMANDDNSRNSIVADFPPECQLLRRALWDHMVLPGDRRLAYRDLPSNAWD